MKGGLLWQGKALSGNKKNLAGELCVVAREFSGLSLMFINLEDVRQVFSHELTRELKLYSVKKFPGKS